MRGGEKPLRRTLLSLEGGTYATIAQTLLEPEASPLRDTLLTVESGTTEHVQKDFATAGTTHVIAISGFNIAQTT